MCGIAGVVNFRNREDKEGLLRSMLKTMHHRGPDASGLYIDGPAGIAHTRLSIIDLAGGDQPICNEDKTIWIVFNGEIFNYPDLTAELKGKGHRFYTKTDTEVLIHLYEEYGTSMLEKINGQFAFAIWDGKREQLFLARDRMGIRPLFYHFSQQRLVFGSEVKSIFADPAIKRSLDLNTLYDTFICWSALGDASHFKEIKQLKPGHYAVFTKDSFKVKQYWSLPSMKDEFPDRSLDEWVEELRSLILDAVKIRLRADVPVGAYLSGGLDSTYISSLVKQNFNNELKTFSIGFTSERFDESAFQKIARENINTTHKAIECSENDISAVFPDVIWHTEAPVLRTSPSPMYLLSKLVRDNGLKVVLTGEGADEIFAGYNIFKEDRIRRFWARDPESKMRPLLLRRLYPYIFSGGDKRAVSFLENFFRKNLSNLSSPGYSHFPRWQNTSHLNSFLSDEIKNAIAGADSFESRYEAALPKDFMKNDPLSRAQYIESTIFLPNYLLSSQGDRMAMGNSIEGRFPFLDHRVVEFAFSIPPKYRLNGLTEKFILKESAKEVIPEELIERPKQPYRAPISECFFGSKKREYVSDLLSEDAIKESGYFNADKVKRLLKKCSLQNGTLLSERENMAVVGILSTQLVDKMFVKEFSSSNPSDAPEARVIKMN